MTGARAGILAAASWAASEPLLRRLFRTPYSDVRLLGRTVTSGRAWPLAGLALHMANGAVFGTIFESVGLRGVRAAMVAAEAENVALWPLMVVVDRLHPDRREGRWPRLATNGRVIGYEIATHAIFGTVLGLALPRQGKRE